LIYKDEGLIFIVGMFISFFICAVIYGMVVRPSWRAECVNRGIAEWHISPEGVTEFLWKEDSNDESN
jgi:RsiW-degrading membrane proteinase PrsW (M82 family)